MQKDETFIKFEIIDAWQWIIHAMCVTFRLEQRLSANIDNKQFITIILCFHLISVLSLSC